MKTLLNNVIVKVTLLSAMVVLTSVASAQGQSLGHKVKVNIPFDFTVSEQKLPAGEYWIGRAMQNDVVLLVTEPNGRSKAMRLSNSVETSSPSNKGRVVFHRYGNEYFLFQVWQAGARVGRQLPESKSERIARSSSRTVVENIQAETVTISVDLQ